MRMPPELIAAADAWGEANDIGRSEAIRRLVEIGLTVRTKSKQPTAARAERAKTLALQLQFFLEMGSARVGLMSPAPGRPSE